MAITAVSSRVWRLTALELEVLGPDTVTANGNQQVVLQAFIKAMLADPDNPSQDVEVDLTQKELNSLVVCMYETDAEVPWDSKTEGWSVSRTHKGFEASPMLTDIHHGGHQRQAGGLYIRFYLSGLPRVSRQSGTDDVLPEVPSRFAIGLTGDTGVRYMSNGKFWTAEGVPDRNQALPAFPSVYVTPKSPPRYSASLFSLRRFALAQADSAVHLAAGIENFVFVISLESGGQAIELRRLSSVPEGMVQWDSPLPSDLYASYTGYFGPRDSHIIWNPSIAQGSVPPPAFPALYEGLPVLVLVGRLDVPRQPSAPGGPCRLTLLDLYGNSTTLLVEFEGPTTQRWNLKLT